MASPRIPRARRGSSPHTRGARVIGPPTRCISRDHPRIRGEHRQDPHRCRDDAGIIPAYAGSTDCLNCGVVESTGSSPHTRGAPRSLLGSLSMGQDHPRIRGEHFRLTLCTPIQAGIIPAYAGSTNSFPLASIYLSGSSPHTRGARTGGPCARRPTRDHPRIRGEHHCAPSHHVPRAGIIPAYAGSTCRPTWQTFLWCGSSPHTRGAPTCWRWTRGCARDHPRIRGEHPCHLPSRSRNTGSSPHTRGARLAPNRATRGRRIIPAYAGSTCSAACSVG